MMGVNSVKLKTIMYEKDFYRMLELLEECERLVKGGEYYKDTERRE